MKQQDIRKELIRKALSQDFKEKLITQEEGWRMMEKKQVFNVQCQPGQSELTLKTGNDVIKLKDYTCDTFSARDIPAFIDYLTNRDIGGIDVFCGSNRLIAYYSEEPEFQTRPVAACALLDSQFLEMIRAKNHIIMQPKAFDTFLKSMRPYYDKNGRELEIRNENLEINSVTNAKRIKNRDGTFTIMVTRKNADGQQLILPETVAFDIPLLANHDDLIEVKMDVTFDYDVVDGDFRATWRLDCWNINDFVEVAQKNIVENYFEGKPWKRYWGQKDIHRQTDLDLYLLNKQDR